MSLSQPRTLFGVHTMAPYNPSTGEYYGIARVIQGSTFKMEGDVIELKGGSNRFSWKVEDGDINAEYAFTMSEYPDWLFQLFGGKAPTTGSAEASGNLGTVTNVKGTSIVAATGILGTLALDVAADLKFGHYLLKATDADTLAVYVSTNIDFGRGTDVDYTSDLLLVGSFNVSTGAATGVAGLGWEATGGASVTAFVAGDTAEFKIRPINTYNRTVRLGGIADTFPEFGAFLYGQKSGSGTEAELRVFRMKTIGLTLGAERKQFGQSEYTAKAYYDSVKDGVCDYTEIE